VTRFGEAEFARVKDIMPAYDYALQIMATKLRIIYMHYESVGDYNPINHIQSRLKSFESMAEKLSRKGLPLTAGAAREYLDDIAGVRVICSFAKDIATVVDTLERQQDIYVVRKTDYIESPKETGYRSYHLIVEVPIYLPADRIRVKAEVQIRTQGMDFWAGMEHKARYKNEGTIPPNLARELRVCSERIAELDRQMSLIHDKIRMFNDDENAAGE